MTELKPLVFRFADIEVRERKFSIVCNGEVITVEPKAFRFLLFLPRNPQKLIAKDELLDAVWAGGPHKPSFGLCGVFRKADVDSAAHPSRPAPVWKTRPNQVNHILLK